MIGTNYVNREIDNYGGNVTLKTVTRTYNDEGDEDRTYSDSTIPAVVNVLGGDNILVREGRFSEDGKIFFVKGTTTVSLGDLIIHSGDTYLIEEIPQGELNSTVYVKELRCNKE